jgi:hypothetical protein
LKEKVDECNDTLEELLNTHRDEKVCIYALEDDAEQSNLERAKSHIRYLPGFTIYHRKPKYVHGTEARN